MSEWRLCFLLPGQTVPSASSPSSLCFSAKWWFSSSKQWAFPGGGTGGCDHVWKSMSALKCVWCVCVYPQSDRFLYVCACVCYCMYAVHTCLLTDWRIVCVCVCVDARFECTSKSVCTSLQASLSISCLLPSLWQIPCLSLACWLSLSSDDSFVSQVLALSTLPFTNPSVLVPIRILQLESPACPRCFSVQLRSEERGVGTECRCRWSPDH